MFFSCVWNRRATAVLFISGRLNFYLATIRADHGNCIALTFARTETKMFFSCVWNRATAVLFISGRLKFYHVDGSRADSAGAPSVLIAYGDNNADVLRDCGIPGKFLMLDN